MAILDRARPALSQVLATLRDGASRARVTVRVSRSTGLAQSMRPAGVRTLLTSLLRGKQNISMVFRVHAQNSPDKPALIYRDRRYTYGELDRELDRLAGALAAAGAKKGTSAVLMLKNRPEFFLLQSALTRLGASAVSVSWRSTSDELAFLVKHSGAKLVFFDADVVSTLDAAAPSLPIPKSALFSVAGAAAGFARMEDLYDRTATFEEASEDAAVVIYTSGTTGKPKGAVRKFPKEAFAQALRFVEQTPMRHEDVHLAVCPLYHSTAFGFAALTFLLGGTVVLLDGFEPEAFLDAVERHRVTHTAVVPTMLHRLLTLGKDRIAARDLSSLRAVFTGGAPLPGPVAVAAMDALGPVLFNFYGATETGLVTLASPEDLRRSPTTIGRAIPGNEIRLLDDAGNEVKRGEVGELYVRNPLLVEGYHQDQKATSSSMRDGFFSVGDLARVDLRGCFHIEGRKRDMIISGGVNVYPAEIEGVLELHPEISEVAVVGMPDLEWGERVRAFVVLRSGSALTEGTLKQFCKEKLAGPKQPRDFVFLEALPRNPTGKVLKRELRG